MEFKELMEKAFTKLKNGKTEEALKNYRDAMNIADSDDKRAMVLRGIAGAYIGNGKIYRAQEYLLQGLNFALKSKNNDVITEIYASLINMFAMVGDIKACEKYIEEGRRYANMASDRVKFNFYNLIAIYNFDRGRIGYSERYWRECLEIGKRKNDESMEAIAYNNMGEIYRIRGDYKRALKYYNMAYETSKKVENYDGMAVNLLNMGMVERNMGKFEEGEEHLIESLNLYEKHKSRVRAAASHRELAMLLADKGEQEKAVKHGEIGLKLAMEASDYTKIGELNLALGYVYEKGKNLRESLKFYTKAREIFAKTENKVRLSECELYMGRVFLSAGKREAAEFHLKRARNIAEKIGEFRITQMANSLLSKC